MSVGAVGGYRLPYEPADQVSRSTASASSGGGRQRSADLAAVGAQNQAAATARADEGQAQDLLALARRQSGAIPGLGRTLDLQL